jgi:hypothetical protein
MSFTEGEKSSLKFPGKEMVIMLFYEGFVWKEKYFWCNKSPNNVPSI